MFVSEAQKEREKSVVFTDAVSCQHCMTSVISEWNETGALVL